MYKRIAALILATSLGTGNLHAQIFGLSDAQKRLRVVPLIRALTNCVSRETLADTATPEAYRSGSFSVFVQREISSCPEQVRNLLQIYDQVYGYGQGLDFLKGAYASDVPRAALTRIKPQLEAKVADLNRQDEERRSREAEDRRLEAIHQEQTATARAEEERRAEAERIRQTALAEQQAATAKAAAAQAEAEAKTVAAKAEAERLQRVEVANRAAKLLAEKALQCGREQLRSLVKSGEASDVLASAVMTICESDVGHFIDAGINEYKLENQVSSSGLGEGLIRERLRAETREHVVALAVQAKAGVGAFAPGSSN